MKKGILVFMVFIMTFQFVFYQPYKASAVGADTVVKLVGGKAVIRALAEKAGMALSRKQVDNVAGFIEKKTFDGDTKAIDFVNKVNSLSGSPSERSGFKKYLLDPMAWLTGLDLIFLAVGAFQDGYDNNTPVELLKMCVPSNPPVVSGKPYYTYYSRTDGTGIHVIVHSVNTATFTAPNITGLGTFYDYSWNGSTWSYFDDGTNYQNIGTSVMLSPSPCSTPIVQEDVINITNVDSSVINHFDSDTYNTNTVYNIEIEMPDSPNYDDATPWNEIDPNIGQEVGEAESNPEPEEKPAASSWWEWLFAPLKAIGDFIAGLGDFLLGILVPSADSVTGIFNGISDSFKAKIPIADQLGTFFGEIEEIQATETPTAPTFDVTMPVEWGGGTFPMIDFSYFDQWRNWVLNFIRFTAWFIFLKRLYARIPRMIY